MDNLSYSAQEVQLRLSRLGYDIPENEQGDFGPETLRSIRSYQEIHGLAITGQINDSTYTELVASSYKLGDRLLYERQPPFRGDDVTELQHRLNSLGFDAGREDGIFRTETARALREFQRNQAISADGICGPNTLLTLARVSTFASNSTTPLREQIKWQSRDNTISNRIGIVLDPTFTVVGDRLIKELFELGMSVPIYYETVDGSSIAREANEANIDFLFALIPSYAATSRCIFFSTSRYRSLVGVSLASSIQHELSKIIKSDPDDIVGRMHPILSESKMPSVIIELCDTTDISMVKYIRERNVAIAQAIAIGINKVITHKQL